MANIELSGPCRPLVAIGRASVLFAALAVADPVMNPAKAQDGNDVSRLTCAQFLQLRQSDREQLLVWLAGYYAGGAQRPIINGRLLTESAGAIDTLCRNSPAAPMIGDQMRAVITGLPANGGQGAQGGIVVPSQSQAAPAVPAPPASAPSAAPVPNRPQPQP
jgi:hypothetical protein